MVGFYPSSQISLIRPHFCHCTLATVQDYENGEDIQVLRSKFQEAARDNDISRAIVWAGTGVGDMKDIRPAKVTIVVHFHRMESSTDIFLFNRS